MLNAILIEQIQSYPDTTITLINGKKIVVRNPEKEVARLITSYFQKVCGSSIRKVGESSE